MEMCVWDLFLNEVEYLNCAITALVIITVYWHLLSANYQELTCGVGESPPWSERLVAGPSPAWAQPKSAAWVALFNEHHVHAHECTWHLYDPFLGCSSLIKLAGVTSDLMPYAPDTWVAADRHQAVSRIRWEEKNSRKAWQAQTCNENICQENLSPFENTSQTLERLGRQWSPLQDLPSWPQPQMNSKY